LFQERNLRPRRAEDSTRWLMSFLSQWFDWRHDVILEEPHRRTGPLTPFRGRVLACGELTKTRPHRRASIVTQRLTAEDGC